MVLEKLKSKTFGQRFKTLVLGTEKPIFLTRVSVISGFIVWLYLFSWQLLTFASILLLENLDNSPRIRASYNSVGFEHYHYLDTINRLFIHSAIQIALFFVILFSFILIWRKKKLGLILHLIGYGAVLVFTFLIMGTHFLANEIPIIDFILIFASMLYFGLGLFLFYRKNETELA